MKACQGSMLDLLVFSFIRDGKDGMYINKVEEWLGNQFG